MAARSTRRVATVRICTWHAAKQPSMSDMPVVMSPHGSRLSTVVQRSIAASIGFVSDSTLPGEAGAVALADELPLLDAAEAVETVPTPVPDTGVGTLCV